MHCLGRAGCGLELGGGFKLREIVWGDGIVGFLSNRNLKKGSFKEK